MSGYQVEVVHGDSADLVHLTLGGSGVGFGAAEGGREELHLFAFEARQVGSAEEASQFVVGEDSGIEVLDDRLKGLGTADLLIDARHRHPLSWCRDAVMPISTRHGDCRVVVLV